MTASALAFAVYVGPECVARFVHAPDADHYRHLLVHRIRDEAPDLDPRLIAACVAVRDDPRANGFTHE